MTAVIRPALQDAYEREQLIAEIERLRAENEQLRDENELLRADNAKLLMMLLGSGVPTTI